MKAEFQNWWRSQTVHPSRLQPTVPICPCAACFNGTGHGQEVFRDPIDPGEVLPPRSNTSAAIVEKPREEGSKLKLVKKPWYKQASSLARKPSMASVASDLVPLCSTPTTSTQRVSFSSETTA
ncbi:uncharacterized protein F4817DRAFT_26505 [Daldinia loculata]|uniref:uncharacterized protein n=1 Tax=Daldinia loculata TaxID=103429 RepID=UPI0020C56C21|nr:uncharacterized protein F4817DRAFT_26505 [Daldinia loculata]KAI1649612.1 hypothetical protein F4817DRAFT_26505 [Daldinia loculata]